MTITVKVPATTGNVGPGYDCQGMALGLYNVFTFREGPGVIPQTKNLIYDAFAYLFTAYHLPVPKVNIQVEAAIPQARGLGSSAACIVGGLMAANQWAGLNLTKQELLKYATHMEGHPDNVAPALFGGHVTSLVNEEVYYFKKMVSNQFRFVLLVPDFELKTADARKVVKKEVTLENAVSNIASATLISDALGTGDFPLLKGAPKDRLHEPYRKGLIEDYPIFDALCSHNNGVLFISGAGPTLLVIYHKENKAIEPALQNHPPTKATWKILHLAVDHQGALIL